METLTQKDLDHFAKLLAEREQRLGEEIRRVLARDVAEVRDIEATQARIAAGTDGGVPDRQALHRGPAAARETARRPVAWPPMVVVIAVANGVLREAWRSISRR